MIGNMSLLREFYEHFADSSPGVVGFEDYESLFTHARNKMTITEKFPICHFLAILHSLEMREAGSA